MSGMAVHLLRHGTPVQPGLLLGQRDDPSLPAGVDACVKRADRLDVNRIVSSDLIRARAPARRIAALRGLETDTDIRWRELDFGAWTGLHPAAVDPAAQARFWNDPETAPPPGGERWSQLCARVGAALADLSEPTLIVTHGGAMRAALAVLFHMEHRHVWAFDLPYAALLSLRIWPGEAAQITGLAT